MRFFRSIFILLCTVSLMSAASASAQSGVFHYPKSTAKSGGAHPDSEPPIGSSAIYILRVATSPNGLASSIVDCNASNPYIAQDSDGDCYVQADTSGNFDLTDAYSCDNDSDIIYFEAIGGTISGGTNNQIAFMMVPSSSQNCGYYFNNSSTAFIVISDFTNVMTAFGAGVFASTKHSPYHLYDSLGVYNTANDQAALLSAFDYVNGTIASNSGFYGGSDTNVENQLDTLADVIASCVDSYGGTTSGTRCGTLFGDTTQGSFQSSSTTSAPINTWMSIASMAQDPSNNVSTQYNLIAARPPWVPFDSSSPSMWTVPVEESSQPTVSQSSTASSATHSTSTYTNTLTIYGTNLLTASGGCPTAIVAGYYAAIASGTTCTSTSFTVNVPKYTNKGGLGVYVDGVASTFIPFTVN